MLEIGYDVDVIDEPQPVAAPTATDTAFLLHTTDAVGEPATAQELTSPQDARDVYGVTEAIQAEADAFFGEGGARLVVASLNAANLPGSLAAFGPNYGPGQLVAPEIVTAAPVTTLAEWAWANNRLAILNGADGANVAALQALAAAVKAGAAGKGRFAELESDTLLIPGAAPGQTREVSAAIVKAALIARNDIETGNPNLAAAGIQQARTRYVLGIKAERSEADRQALAVSQINTFKTVFGQAVVPYGYLTLANLVDLPHWWDVSGSRTVMAARAREANVAEQHMFGNIDGEGNYLTRYEGGLRGELADLQRLQALYGTSTSPGYRVTVSQTNNPIEELAQGRVTAQITLKTSPHARSLQVNIVRRALTQEV